MLDRPIEWVERLVNEFNPSRESIEDDRVDLSFVYIEEEVFDIDDAALGLGDVALFARHAVLDDPRRRASLGVHVELPVGDEEKLFGNGSTDVALSGSYRESIGLWAIHAGASVVFPGDFFDGLGIETRTHYSLTLAGERRIWRRGALLAQIGYHESAFSRTDLLELEQGLYEIAVAYAFETGSGAVIKIGGIENLTVRPAADFTLVLSVETGF